MKINELTLTQAKKLIDDKKISCVELFKEMSALIKNDELNAFISSIDDMETAASVDRRIMRGEKVGKLAGLPIGIKDNIMVKNYPVTCGSRLFAGNIADKDAAVIDAIRAEDGVIVGKTNMDEFAMGSSNMTSAYGYVKNPKDTGRVPGGSSGGSAAAVSAGLCLAALGSDTGGSIRQPASYCGVVGLKPTAGSVSSKGMYALAQTFDSIGTLTKTTEDCELLFDVIREKNFALREPLKKVRFGLIEEYERWYDKDTTTAINRAMEIFGRENFVTVSVRRVRAAFITYCALGNAQSAQNLHLFGDDITRGEQLGYEVKRRLLIGNYVLTHKELMEKALKVRENLIDDFASAFEKCDVLVTPTAPSVAFAFDEDKKSDKVVYSDLFTQPPSIAGLPAISVPCINGEDGLPLGIQLTGAKGSEKTLFKLGKILDEVRK